MNRYANASSKQGEAVFDAPATLTVIEDGEQLDVAAPDFPSIASMVYEFSPGQFHIKDGYDMDAVEAAVQP